MIFNWKWLIPCAVLMRMINSSFVISCRFSPAVGLKLIGQIKLISFKIDFNRLQIGSPLLSRCPFNSKILFCSPRSYASLFYVPSANLSFNSFLSLFVCYRLLPPSNIKTDYRITSSNLKYVSSFSNLTTSALALIY